MTGIIRRFVERRASGFVRPAAQMERFYNRIYRYYPLVERYIRPQVARALARADEQLGFTTDELALEYCCGSGVMSVQLARRFGQVVARDLSEKMLSLAKEQGIGLKNLRFEKGDIFNIRDEPGRFDYGFISYGLHLFSPADRRSILMRLLDVCEKGVVIIEHQPKWQLAVALVEWWEGSHYSDFITESWEKTAAAMGVSCVIEQLDDVQLQIWRKKEPSLN